jgi:hypothetical protein
MTTGLGNPFIACDRAPEQASGGLFLGALILETLKEL